MEKETASIMKRLVSALEGAPYPTESLGELYRIWYEHAQRAAQEALEYLSESGNDSPEEETEGLPSF